MATVTVLRSDPAELLSDPAELLSNPAELLSNPAELLSNPAELLSNPPDVMQQTTVSEVAQEVIERLFTTGLGLRSVVMATGSELAAQRLREAIDQLDAVINGIFAAILDHETAIAVTRSFARQDDGFRPNAC